MNRNYVNGSAREYRIMKKLRDEGWEVVERSAGSHGAIDVFAMKTATNTSLGQMLLIQCKGGKSAKRERKKAEREMPLMSGLYSVKVEVV